MRFVDDYRCTFQSHRSEYMFKALAMDKCIQANKRIMVRTEDWGTITFKKWGKKKKGVARELGGAQETCKFYIQQSYFQIRLCSEALGLRT